MKQTADPPPYDMKKLKEYISVCRKIKPQMTPEAGQLLRKFYIEIRSNDKRSNDNSYRITVRQLESMIRLSEAYARLELSLRVESKHVKEAYRLLSCSILKLEKAAVELNEDDVVEGIDKMILDEKFVL